MRQLRVWCFSLAILLGLAGPGFAAFLPDLANWGGPHLLELAQSKFQGKITVGEISGNPFTGITYKDLVVRGPEGQVILKAPRLEIRLSLWSVPALHLQVASLALVSPQFYLTEAEAGRWNLENLLKTPETPAPPPDALTAYLLREIEFSDLQVSQGEIVLTRRGAATHFTDLDFRSNVVLRHWQQPQQQIRINAAHLKVTTPQGPVELDTRLSYGAGLAAIDHLALKLAGREVLSFQGELCRPLTELSCKVEGQWGPLAGAMLHELWPRWPQPWDLSGKFDFASTPKGAQLTAQGGVGQASFALAGKLDGQAQPAVFELDVDLKGLSTAQLQEIQGLDPKQIQGLTPVNGRLHLEGTGMPWNPAAMEARLDLEPFQYQESKVDQARFSLQGDARGQELRGLLVGNFGTVNLNSRGQLLPLGEAGPGLSGEVTFGTKGFQPALWGWRQYPGTQINSSFTGKFRLPRPFSLGQLYLAGKLQANGRLGKEPLKDLQSAFVLEGRKLTLSQASIQLPGVAATLKGTLTETGLDLSYTGSVSGSHNLPLPPGPAFNYLQAQGTVRGTWQAPQLSVLAKLQKVSYPGVTLEAASLTANLGGCGWPPDSGSLQLQGAQLHTGAGDFARLNLSAQGEDGSWQFQAAAVSPKLPRTELTGVIDLNTRPVAVAVNRFSWQSQTVALKNKAPFQVWLLPGWEISTATFQLDGGTVTFQGKAWGHELAGLLEVRDLDAGLLQALGVQAQGKLNGKLTLGGTPQTPAIDGRLALSGGRLKDFPIQMLATTLSYQAGQLQVAGSLEEGTTHSRFTWNGSVPVHITFLPPKFVLGDQGLDLRLQSQNLNLSILKSLVSEVQAAESSMEIAAQAKGNPHQPQVSGYIRWGAGSLKVRPAGIPYQLAPGEIRLEGSKIIIPGIVLTRDGTLTLSGEIALAEPTRVAAKAQLDNFQALDRGGNEIWSNGFIDISGPLTALTATGRLVVPKAQFRPTFFRSDMDPDIVLLPPKLPSKTEASVPFLYRDMRIDVAIESTGNAWLKDPLGQVEMRASIRALKPPGQKLALGGTVHALKGTVDLHERTFKVERAVLTLPGVPGKPGIIDGKATHEMDDVTLVLTVTGALSNASIRLESLPPLPPADVLSYLAFGAPAATLTKEQYMALGAEQLGVLGGVTTKKLDEILGSTLPFLGGGELKMKTGTMGGRPTVGVAKEITKNVSVIYGRNLNEERGQYENQVGIQYKVNRHWSVESQIGPRNSGADVFFNYDF